MQPARLGALSAVLSLALLTTPARAQVPDHLKCYKVKDPQANISYTADLNGLVAEPGCTIKVPATMACVPATKTNVTPTPPGGGGTGTPNSFFCYKVKCPKATLPTLPGHDQFGSRTVTPSTAKLLCAPLAGPTTTTTTSTTTTTTTTTSTTTTMPRFVDNGDGTVTDHQTGLIWEKKDNTCPGPHCVNDRFFWSSGDTAPDGTAFTSFLPSLNGGATGVGNCASPARCPSGSCTNPPDTTTQSGGFAGHCDWRLPTIVELGTIVDTGVPGCGAGSPCIDPIFGPTVTTFYWSSISGFTSGCGCGGPSPTSPCQPRAAWSREFASGGFGLVCKGGLAPLPYFVRAVRGGS